MSSPSHHIAEELLLEYTSGTTPEALALLVATHLALCPPCRRLSEGLEAVGGELLESAPAVALSTSIESVLSRLDDAFVEPPLQKIPAAGHSLPEPLRSYVGPLESVRWRSILPGVQQIELPLTLDGIPVRLTRLRGGVLVPAHTHTAEEMSLVLTGGFEDEHGHYVRGDVARYDQDDTHTQHIDSGEPCITLAVNRGRMIPVDWKGRLLEKLTGGF